MEFSFVLTAGAAFFLLILNIFTVIKYAKLKSYDRRKTEFFTNIVHEFKTPLTIILSAIQLIEKKMPEVSENSSYYQKDLNILKRNCQKLLQLSNNLLDFEKAESGKARLTLTNCELSDFIDEIVRSVSSYALQNHISIEFRKPESKINITADKDKLERILLNLLSNAIKFTREGGSVLVSLDAGEENAIISVKDTGTGIPKDKLKKVFDRFMQIRDPNSPEYEGSGIGLSLVKFFTELHGGKIKVLSEPGKGSEFIICLPLAPSGANPAQPQDFSNTARLP
jgi:signal transduction histidine kinase